MTRLHNLQDVEAAVYSAAFVLCGPHRYMPIAAEAALYITNTSGDYVDAQAEAYKRRISNRTLGSWDAIVLSL